MEGSPLTFVEGILEIGIARECLQKLLTYVKASQASIMRKLLYLKQNPREPITAFVPRLNIVVVRAGVKEKRLREAFDEAHTAKWQQKARSILAFDNRVDSKELIRRLMEIAEPAGNSGDAMELGQLQSESEEGDTRVEAALVGNGGKIQMPAQFANMRELLYAIETALPSNEFLG